LKNCFFSPRSRSAGFSFFFFPHHGKGSAQFLFFLRSARGVVDNRGPFFFDPFPPLRASKAALLPSVRLGKTCGPFFLSLSCALDTSRCRRTDPLLLAAGKRAPFPPHLGTKRDYFGLSFSFVGFQRATRTVRFLSPDPLFFATPSWLDRKKVLSFSPATNRDSSLFSTHPQTPILNPLLLFPTGAVKSPSFPPFDPRSRARFESARTFLSSLFLPDGRRVIAIDNLFPHPRNSTIPRPLS